MNYWQLVNELKIAALENPYVKTWIPDVNTINSYHDLRYGVVALEQGTSQIDKRGWITWSGTLYYINRVVDEPSDNGTSRKEDNALEIQAQGITILHNLVKTLGSIGVDAVNYSVFKHKFLDYCAGASVQVTLRTPFSICWDDFANPESNEYTLNVLITNGTVNATLHGVPIQLPYTGPKGSVISLEVIPNENYRFRQWTDGNTSNPRTIILNSDRTLSCVCEYAVAHTLTFLGTHCSCSPSSYTGYAGDTVLVEASSNEAHYHWSHWSDGDTNRIRTFTMPNEDRTYTAYYEEDAQYTLLFTATHGTVDHDSFTGYTGDSVTVTATAESSTYEFSSWDDGSLENPRTFTIGTESKAYNAIFEQAGVKTLKFISSGTSYINLTNTGRNPNCEYSLDAGVTWNTMPTSYGQRIPFNGTIYVRGTNTSGWSTSQTAYSSIVLSGDPCAASGSVMSLIDGIGNSVTIPNNNCFYRLFYGQGTLTVAPDLPATTLKLGAYNHMFENCTGLITAPALPATTMYNYCYSGMFWGCSSLNSAPHLPSTYLKEGCYCYMFSDCTSLVNPPTLASITGYELYSMTNMFSGCSSLVSTPVMNWKNFNIYAFNRMFLDCTSLTTIAGTFSVNTAEGCYEQMFQNCTSLENAPSILPSTVLNKYCYRYMFDGCTALKNAPELPATNVTTGCYNYMFRNCTNLTGPVVIKANYTPNTGWTGDMFTNAGTVHPVSTSPASECRIITPASYTSGWTQEATGADPLYWNPVQDKYTITASCTYGTITGSGTYNIGTSVVLRVTPNTYYHMTESAWSGLPSDVVFSEDYKVATFAAYDNYNVSAVCVEDDKYTLNFSATNGVCKNYDTQEVITSFTAHTGQSVKVQVVANSGYEFEKWNDGNIDNPRTFTVGTTSASYVANCKSTATYKTLTFGSAMYGTATATVDGVEVSSPATVRVGASVVLTATATTEHWHFNEWTGTTTTSDNPYSFVMPNEDVTETATYEEDTKYTLTFDAVHGTATGKVNGVEVTSPIQVYADSVVELTASTTESHYHFVNWSGTTTSTDNPYTFNMPSGDVTETANYVEDTKYTLRFNGSHCICTPSSFTGYDGDRTTVVVGSIATHYHWYKWNDGNTELIRTFTIEGAEATYTALCTGDLYTISVTGTNCSVTGGGERAYGSICTLVATAESGFETYASSWSGLPSSTTYSSDYRTASFTVTGDVSATCKARPQGWAGLYASSTGTTTVYLTSYNYHNPNCEYSLDNGTTWITLPRESVSAVSFTSTIWFRGNNEGGFNGGIAQGNAQYSTFTFGGDTFHMGGSVMSLIDQVGELLRIPDLAVIHDYHGCFMHLFENATLMITAPELPAVNRGYSCYKRMFAGCTGLINAPSTLPFTDVSVEEHADYCCQFMFYGCTSLVNSPESVAQTMGRSTFAGMFYGCTSLVRTPIIDGVVTTNAEYSCQHMFHGCTSLRTISGTFNVPVNSYSCDSMFYGCTKLLGPVTLRFTTIEEHEILNMFYNAGIPDGGGTMYVNKYRAALISQAKVDTNYWNVISDVTSTVTCTPTNCSVSGTGSYKQGLSCTLIATPDEGYLITAESWSGLPEGTTYSSDYRTATFTVSSDVSCNCDAVESTLYVVTCTTTDCSVEGTGTYTEGTTVTLVATPDTHYVINATSWSNMPTGTTYSSDYRTATFTMPSNDVSCNCDAVEAPQHTLTFNNDGYCTCKNTATGTEIITFTGYEGDTVEVEATDITAGRYWSKWSDNVTTNPRTFTIGTTDKTYTATTTDVAPNYLTFTANTDGSTIALNQVGTFTGTWDIETSTDASNWSSYTLGDVITLTNVGDKVYFRGTKDSTAQSSSIYRQFIMTGSISASSDCTSLLNGAGSVTSLSSYGTYTFGYLFYGCTSLTSAPALPATTLATYCYRYMFQGCTSLTSAPALPATTLAGSCYRYMFYGCTSLVTAPILPATTLATYCYNNMFQGCTSLTSAPELPATTLATSCYESMFQGCTSLTTAPILPATTLATYCYSYLFSGCTSLTSAPALPATTLANGCYRYMFYGCTSLTGPVVIYATSPYYLRTDSACKVMFTSSGTATGAGGTIKVGGNVDKWNNTNCGIDSTYWTVELITEEDNQESTE